MTPHEFPKGWPSDMDKDVPDDKDDYVDEDDIEDLLDELGIPTPESEVEEGIVPDDFD